MDTKTKPSQINPNPIAINTKTNMGKTKILLFTSSLSFSGSSATAPASEFGFHHDRVFGYCWKVLLKLTRLWLKAKAIIVVQAPGFWRTCFNSLPPPFISVLISLKYAIFSFKTFDTTINNICPCFLFQHPFRILLWHILKKNLFRINCENLTWPSPHYDPHCPPPPSCWGLG